MSPERVALGERVFLSADVGRIAGVSLRQLQWWDERKLVSPCIEDHRRVYVPDQVVEILVVAALRRKGRLQQSAGTPLAHPLTQGHTSMLEKYVGGRP